MAITNVLCDSQQVNYTPSVLVSFFDFKVLLRIKWKNMLNYKYTFKLFLFKPDVANRDICWTSPKMSFVLLRYLLKRGISGQHLKTKDFFLNINFQVLFRNLKTRPRRPRSVLQHCAEAECQPSLSAGVGSSPINHAPQPLSVPFIIMLLLLLFF